MRRLSREGLQRLIEALQDRGHTVVGPTVRDHAIVLGEIESAADLPVGWTDSQGPGTYRIAREGDRVFEGYVVGPDSLKQSFFPAREVLYRVERREDGKVGFTPSVPDPPRRAFLGVRSCDLHAAGIQDRTFLDGPYEEPRYRARRDRALLIAVNCTEPGDLCFCTSTRTGPRVTGGADLVLTERDNGFLVEAGTDTGRAILDTLDTREATGADEAWLEAAMVEAEGKMGRAVDTEALPGLLFGRLAHPRWLEVAERCLACGNCTNVCPTCFCSTADDPSDLTGESAEHVRLWDSCYTRDHAAIHGGSFRETVKDRYRQWLTHKVGSWVSQFGTSGCVGCGRCIAWCPVGIDLTEEIAALRQGEGEAPMPEPPSFEMNTGEDLTPRPAAVVAVTRESGDTVTLHVQTDGVEPFVPGQFNQLSLPGIGEVPISISGQDGPAIEHTIRAVGAVTKALCALGPGDELGIRGPYGAPWPLDAMAGGSVVVIAGGIGLAPLRGALREMLDRPEDFPKVSLFYGARSPDDAIFVREMVGWLEEPAFSLHLTVDHAPATWRGHVGVVTRLLAPDLVPNGSRAMICGPEIMMGFTIDALERLDIPHDRVWVTMERHMKCATGLCGRCQFGPWFVCKDGPVFRYDTIEMLFGKEGY